MTTAAERMTATPNGRPPPRLHLQPNLQPTLSRRTLLDGGWWPRSTDPVSELADLIRTLNGNRSRVRSVMLRPAGWDSHPPWMTVAGRVRLSWFTSASAGLLIAIRVDGDRVDLLVVPPDTQSGDRAGGDGPRRAAHQHHPRSRHPHRRRRRSITAVRAGGRDILGGRRRPSVGSRLRKG